LHLKQRAGDHHDGTDWLDLVKSGRSDPVKVFYIYTVLSNVLFYFVFSVNMIYQVQVARLTPLQLVLIGTMLEGSILLLEIPTGVVADVYSRKLSIIIGVFLIGVGFIIESLFPSFLPILIAQFLWGTGYTFTSGALTAWISDEIGQDRIHNLLMRGAQWEQIGVIIATLIAVEIGSYQINLPILLAGVGFVLLGGYLILFMKETAFHPIPFAERKNLQSMRATILQGFGLIKKNRLLLYLVIVAFFLGLYSEGFDRLWTPHLLNDLSFPIYLGLKPVVWFGIMTIIGSLLTLTATEWIRVRLEKSGSVTLFSVMLVSIGLLCLSLILFAFSTNLFISIPLWLVIYVLRRAVSPALTIWYNERLVSRIRATMLSFSSQVDALGQVIGGPPLGWVGNQFGIPLALLVSAISLIPSLAFLIPLLKKSRLTSLEESS
jgi:MFS transporter, DHA3 family, tetracycline resistance protein